MLRSSGRPNLSYMDSPPIARGLTDTSSIWVEPAVVYPASAVGSWWPVPTWNLRAPVRQSLQAAAEPKFMEPEELSAFIGAGATRGAMVGDQSLRKARGKFSVSSNPFHAAAASG